jgi:DNA-binding beta-propeller fold protein YncE
MTGLTGNVPVTVSNLPMTANKSYNLSFFIVQGSPAYIINPIILPITLSNALLAGGGGIGFLNSTGAGALFNTPRGVCIDPAGSNLYVADTYNNRIRRIVISTRDVTTIAGSGSMGEGNNAQGSLATFNNPVGICINPAGTFLFVTDYYNNLIRSISLIYPFAVATVAGSNVMTPSTLDGTGTAARFNGPWGICVNPAGTTLYVSEWSLGGVIRNITISSTVVTTLAGSPSLYSGDGTGASAGFRSPREVAIDTSGSNLYVADFSNNLIRKIVISSSNVTTLAGNGTGMSIDGIGTSAGISQPVGLRLDTFGNIYVLEFASGGYGNIRKIDPSTVVTSLTTGYTSSYGICCDPYGTVLYVADTGTHAIRTTTIASNVTIKWPNASMFSGTINRTEVQSFTLYNSGSAWTALSQLSSFG